MSQSAAILRELQAAPGQWIPMPALAAASGAYAVHSRIADLRAAGHRIENRVLPPSGPTGPRRSEYRLALPRLTQQALPL